MNLHQICQAARGTRCSCGAPPGRPCTCKPGSVCLSRIARARASGLITGPGFAAAYQAAGGAPAVHDPGAAS